MREYHCQAGINVTASHNPKEYNGYKVYWEDGAQLPPHHADAIAKRLSEIDIFNDIRSMPYDEAVKTGMIEVLGAETDEKFLANVMAQVNDPDTVAKVADTFKLVYTPFHGTGHKLIPEALRRMGIRHLICVPEQMVIDGNFPTVVSPNPENPWQWNWPRRKAPTSSWAPTPTPTAWASWSRPRAASSRSSPATRPAC